MIKVGFNPIFVLIIFSITFKWNLYARLFFYSMLKLIK